MRGGDPGLLGGRNEQSVVRADEEPSSPSRRASARREPPTPGSTTARWTPAGTYGSVLASMRAPCRTCSRGMPCDRSMICASGAMPLITPWHVPTKSSWSPKSLRNVTNTALRLTRSRRGARRDRASSPRPPPRHPPPSPQRVVSGPIETAGTAAPCVRTPVQRRPRRAPPGRRQAARRERARASGRAARSPRRARRPAAAAHSPAPAKRTRPAGRGSSARRPPAWRRRGRDRRRRTQPPSRGRSPPPASGSSHPPAQLRGAVHARDDDPVVALDLDGLVAEGLDPRRAAAR